MTANPYPDDAGVLVRYPLTGAQEAGPRDEWPWLPSVIEQRCGPDEWQVLVEDDQVAEPEGGELLYPLAYRDSSEIDWPGEEPGGIT